MIIRLFCSEFELSVKDDEIATLEITNRDCYRRVINELKTIEEKEIKEISILDNDSLIAQKDMEVIFDPYEVDVNDKNYLSKIYKALENHFIKCDDNIFSLNQLSAYINLNFNNLIFGYPLDLTVKSELSFKDYLKFLDLKVAEDGQSVADKLSQFITVNSVIKFCRLLVFVNLKSMLSQEDLKNVMATASRTRCPLLFIESNFDKRSFQNERKLSIDEDLFTVVK